jgi:hypothetical protein
MVQRVLSASIIGLNVDIIEVEVDIQKKVPSFEIVGLPDTTVKGKS